MPYTGRTASSLTNEVLTRVRDPNGKMHTAAFVRDRLTDAQRVLNGILEYVIANTTISVSASRQFYQVSVSVPSAIRVVGFRGSGTVRAVAQVPSLDSLLIYGPYWSRELGDHYLAWAAVGRELVVLYPALRVDGSIGCVYVKLTDAFVSTSTTSEFSPEQCGPLVTLVEALLLLRQRDLAACARTISRLQEVLTVEGVGDIFPPPAPTPGAA